MSDDFDPGDDCPTEVRRPVPHLWHESMKPASVPELPKGITEVGQRALAALRACTAANPAPPRRAAVVAGPAWRDMPHLYRRMVVAAAGVGADVVDKIDRDLTEREKIMMRSAIGDMREWLATVAAL